MTIERRLRSEKGKKENQEKYFKPVVHIVHVWVTGVGRDDRCGSDGCGKGTN